MEEPKTLPESRKRPLENDTVSIQNTPYYKIRAVLRDLRPHFIEVLKTPDFRNCKAADDIREGMKLVMELYREMTAETGKLEKCSNGNIENGQKRVKHHGQQEDLKPGENLLHDVDEASAEPLGDHAPDTFIVGGSAFGWNFVTSHGSKADYYGQTKEDFRAKNAKDDSN
ncbi:hypothetical protein ACP275_02G177000 [Erythranthe tilingii]